VGDPFLPALEERVDPGGPSLESGDMGSTLEKEGQKGDDAAVPVHIWENHFRETLPLPPHFPPLCDDWREKLGAYRSLGLRWWRRQVTQSFWRYVRDRVPNILAGRRPGYVRFQPGRYIWLTHGCSGYQKEWRALHSHPLVTQDWTPLENVWRRPRKATGGSGPGAHAHSSGAGPRATEVGRATASPIIRPRFSLASRNPSRPLGLKRTGSSVGESYLRCASEGILILDRSWG
jgi:hypothetical protein